MSSLESHGYDVNRCRATGKLRSLCYCEACCNADSSAEVVQGAAWADQRRAEKLEELEALRLSRKGSVSRYSGATRESSHEVEANEASDQPAAAEPATCMPASRI